MHPCTIFVFVIPLSSVVVIIITSRGLTGGHKRGYWPAVATGNCPVSESQPREALTPNIAALSLYTRASIFFFQILTEAMNWLVTQTFCCQYTEYLRRYSVFQERKKFGLSTHTWHGGLPWGVGPSVGHHQGPASTRISTRTWNFLSYSNSTRTKHYSDRVVSSTTIV